MARAGKLIVFEGIDGAGKRTQAELLARALEARHIRLERFSFPQYESFFGRLIARFLNGEFGSLDAVDAHLSALLYAGDRFEAKTALESALAAGRTVVADRYIASNLAHQTARVAPERRAGFISWLRELEYGVYELPLEDLVVYLRLAPAQAQRLVEMKETRNYTTLKRDLQEASLQHLEQAALLYDQLATEPNWVIVECCDAPRGTHRTPEEIHADVFAAVESRLVPRVGAAEGKRGR